MERKSTAMSPVLSWKMTSSPAMKPGLTRPIALPSRRTAWPRTGEAAGSPISPMTVAGLGVVEKLDAIEPSEGEVRGPRADQPDQQIDNDSEPYGDGEIDLARGHHGGQHEANHHADQDAEGDERGEEQTSHGFPKIALRREESLAVAGHRRC